MPSRYVVLFFLILFFPSSAIAGGYKIPEQSTNSMALAAAYTANAHGADASYYNPANMVWRDGAGQIEIGISYIKLPQVDFSGTVGGFSADSRSRPEQFYLPNFHYVSRPFGDFRLGLSLVTPFGLSKRWDGALQKLTAEEFTFKTVEANPTVSYKINDRLSVGAGARGIYADGKVRSNGVTLIGGAIPTRLTRHMEGNDVVFAYNLAVTYKPIAPLTLAATYRSRTTAVLEGTAILSSVNSLGSASYDGGGTVKAVLPASLNLAAAYAIGGATVEFVFERTFWGAYKNLDFEFMRPLGSAILTGAFDNPVAKNWKDSNTYRLGLTHRYDENFNFMAGFAFDKAPVPTQTLGFELPDSDSFLFSLGVKCRVAAEAVLGIGYLYNKERNRTVSGNNSRIDGEFSADSHLMNVSFGF